MTALDVTLLDERLGRGSYGTVYRGLLRDSGEPVAVKILPWGPRECSSELKRELKLLQRCSCKYIVAAHGAFSQPKELWIVMECCDLGSLLDVMKSTQESLAERAIAVACRDALRGLDYLHSHTKRIIHRDIKCAPPASDFPPPCPPLPPSAQSRGRPRRQARICFCRLAHRTARSSSPTLAWRRS